MVKKAFLLASIALPCLVLARGQEQKSSLPVSVSPWVLHSKLTHEVIPEYPQFARDRHVEGDAFVDLIVDENGNVKKAKWVDCANCDSTLAGATLEAVMEWKYAPTVVDGKPVAVSSWAAFRFRLEGEPAVEILTRSESTTPATEPPIRAVPRKLRISSGVAESNLLHKVEPEYPREAEIAHVQGDVVIRCLISRQGDIAEAQVISGHPLLTQSALDAVKQWKYKPYALNGEPVEVQTTITIRFHLRR